MFGRGANTFSEHATRNAPNSLKFQIQKMIQIDVRLKVIKEEILETTKKHGIEIEKIILFG